MTRRIRIQILPDGRVLARTDGIKGRACADYIAVIEEILDARTMTSEYTSEYKESQEVVPAAEENVQKLRETE